MWLLEYGGPEFARVKITTKRSPYFQGGELSCGAVDAARIK